MRFIQLCDRDPLLTMLHDFFGANTVRVPDGRIQPLGVLAHRDKRSFFRGSLAPLLVGEQTIDIPITTSAVADLSGRRSRRVTLDLGLFLLRGILIGMGIPSPGLSGKLEGVSHLTFSFPSVQRSFFDVNRLGLVIAGRQINRANPAAEIFFGDDAHQFLIVDTILSSNRINITLGGERDKRVQVDLPGIQQMLANTGASVSLSDEPDYQLSFESNRTLTFAFSCIRLDYDDEGMIRSLQTDAHTRTLSAPAEPQQATVPWVRIGTGPGVWVG